MPDRKMFWRIVRRLFAAQRGRLLVILLALGAGAALTAALLNIQVDAKSRLTKEFRSFGTNVIVAPRDSDASSAPPLLDEAVVKQVRDFHAPAQTSAISNLYLVADVSSAATRAISKAVVAGKRSEFQSGTLSVSAIGQPLAQVESKNVCLVGSKVAEQLQMQRGDSLLLRYSGREERCLAVAKSARGDEEDNQVSVTLDAAQRLSTLSGKISLMQLSVAGTPREIREYIAALAQNIPGADVHGLRQFTDAEAKIYNRISGLLTTTIILVLTLTGLCVMAAMINVAMERKNDVGLMKAIGGTTRRVLRLFLAEAALLGLAGGVVGGAAGLLLSIWLGKTVFGVAARPRLIVYPVSVALTILVAIISAYPLRRLANISPAAVFRGEA
ncbi:MAG: FtsX-like permease family protein [Acidobacteriota bacterium]|nr:FtsX-like permease family protein [Acidobacteriota bacterium]